MEPSGTPITTRSGIWSFLENVLYILGAIGLAVLIQAFIIRPFIVSGRSMDPVIQDREYLMVDEVTYAFIRPPQRGDVIVFKAPPEPKKFYIKRVIGVPGDTVKISNGIITIINDAHPEGVVLKEPYIVHTKTSDNLTRIVPADSYFVMGDNRLGSSDSREWGMLPKENIRGRALIRLLPLTAISYLPGHETYDNIK